MNASPCIVRVVLASWLVLAPFQSSAGSEPAPGTAQPRVAAGKKVTLELTLALADESVVFSNVGEKPLTITQGTSQLVQGLESALEGMQIGDRKQVTVSPSEGFGPVQAKNFQEVPKEQIPPHLLKEGAELQGDGPHGQTVFFRVSQIKEDTVILDFNHPLAGKTLFFDVKVLDIQE